MGIALMLGGGAPNLTLMSGAVAALDKKMKEQGQEFSVVSTAGAGMVVGLLYAAPKGMSRQEALAQSRNMGVHDAIYDLFPVNYKVFHKAGPLAQAYTQFLGNLPKMPMGDSPAAKLFADSMALMLSTMSPSTFDPDSQGLCQPAPWIEDVVDFAALKSFAGDFYMNAYNVTDKKMESFAKHEITPDHFHASLAFPLIYSPFKMNGKTYIEGSAMDTQNFKGLLQRRKDMRANDAAAKDGAKADPREKVDTLVVLDVLGRNQLIREPRNLYDAWVLSIIVPLVAIARDDIKLFQLVHNRKKNWNLLRVNLTSKITDDRWPHVLDWSRSNLDYLYDVGYEAGERFFNDAWDREAEKFKAWDTEDKTFKAWDYDEHDFKDRALPTATKKPGKKKPGKKKPGKKKRSLR